MFQNVRLLSFNTDRGKSGKGSLSWQMPSALQSLPGATIPEPRPQVTCACARTHPVHISMENCALSSQKGFVVSIKLVKNLCHMLGKKGKPQTRLNYCGYLLGDQSISNEPPSMHQRSFYLRKTEVGAELQQLVLNQSPGSRRKQI